MSTTDVAVVKAIRFSSFGGPEVLELVDVEEPEAPADGVVIEVRAAGVNPMDWKIRRGLRAPQPLAAPRGLGSDAAGVITSVGRDVSGFAVGDEVIARGLDGAYAERVAATVGQLTRKPAELTFAQAAGIGVPAGTAYQVLKSLGLAKGENLLVHAGSGGVGQAAIQFARHWGATVVATASPANHARLAKLGAIPVAYGPGLAERIRVASPTGIDAVLDAAGTDEAIDASLALVADRTRIVTVVITDRSKQLGIRAYGGGLLDDTALAWRAAAVGVVADLAHAGAFDIEIAAEYPLAKAADAHRHSETGHVRGKIVLVP